MNPPMVYEETKPNSQSTIKIAAIVASIFATPNKAGRSAQLLKPHVILDGCHTPNTACDFDRLLDIGCVLTKPLN